MRRAPSKILESLIPTSRHLVPKLSPARRLGMEGPGRRETINMISPSINHQHQRQQYRYTYHAAVLPLTRCCVTSRPDRWLVRWGARAWGGGVPTTKHEDERLKTFQSLFLTVPGVRCCCYRFCHPAMYSSTTVVIFRPDTAVLRSVVLIITKKITLTQVSN